MAKRRASKGRSRRILRCGVDRMRELPTQWASARGPAGARAASVMACGSSVKARLCAAAASPRYSMNT